MNELVQQENSYFLVRPYVTILAYLLFWAGMLLQFTPMCSFITLIFPFWFGVESESSSPTTQSTTTTPSAALNCLDFYSTGPPHAAAPSALDSRANQRGSALPPDFRCSIDSCSQHP
jgi:hypothetical protein